MANETMASPTDILAQSVISSRLNFIVNRAFDEAGAFRAVPRLLPLPGSQHNLSFGGLQ